MYLTKLQFLFFFFSITCFLKACKNVPGLCQNGGWGVILAELFLSGPKIWRKLATLSWLAALFCHLVNSCKVHLLTRENKRTETIWPARCIYYLFIFNFPRAVFRWRSGRDPAPSCSWQLHKYMWESWRLCGDGYIYSKMTFPSGSHDSLQ